MKEILGDFRILRQIGKGPLGETYLAEHKFLKKRYAIKVLPGELFQNEGFLKRFEKEVENLAKLEHLNLAKVHSVSLQDNNYFIISDYIADAENLSSYLGSLDSRLSEKDTLALLKQIAYVLDYLHKEKTSHGGLKLNNILVKKVEDEIPHLYLTDAGLSSIVGSGKIVTKAYQMVAETLNVAPHLKSETIYSAKEIDPNVLPKLHRSFLQTYAFLAPEQKVGGIKDKIGPKSDIYAFGVLTYFLLTGTFPEGYFPMPSKVLPGLRFDWDRLIKATMHQDAEDRLDTLMPLMESLSGKPVKELKEVEVEIEKFVPEQRVLTREPTAPRTFKMATAVSTAPFATTSSVTEKKPVINPSEMKRLEFDADPGAIFQAPRVVAPYRPKEDVVREIQPMLTEMVVIEGGEVCRGSNVGARDEKPRHKIYIESFALDVHPVTNEQFVRFLEVMGGEKDSNNSDMLALKESRIKRLGGRLSIESGYAKHPVVGVSWYGALAYAKWVGKRLPTEAEWEVAASGNSEEHIYPFGLDIERSEANFFNSDTTPVMSYPASSIGLYDMSGNVYEWCEDWYGYNYYEHSLQEPTSPKGPPQGVYRVLRGGCWKSLKEDLRCSHRHRNNPGTMNRTYGFRCAADTK